MLFGDYPLGWETGLGESKGMSGLLFRLVPRSFLTGGLDSFHVVEIEAKQNIENSPLL